MANTDFLQYVKKIKIESAYLPTIEISDPFQAGPPSAYLQALKPKISIETSLSDAPIVAAPYGDPGPTKWPWIELGILIASGFVLGGIAKKFSR